MFQLRRVFPYLVATATGIASGVYIFKPLILENASVDKVNRKEHNNPGDIVEPSTITQNDTAEAGSDKE
ncbi:hypothetical protein Hypma_015993 [Hypsizygus marmoreus]|uniref:Uncharacterized protein n=1 Tax=Hypsizygus marmoreus TaxID=39966 RepID=A0A369K7I5_HYPMA|nr:hypothetical protein Hypma_015993 [Hypsizygus marmoreus]